MPSIWSDPTLARYIQRAEVLYSTEYPCIIDRLALDIVNGTAEYTLPEYVLSIRRITWLGIKVYPKTHRRMRDEFWTGTEGGRPEEYVFNNIGKQKIQFFPVPQIDITAVQTNLFGTEIPNQVIVEYFRVSNNIDFTIPAYFRRQVIKAYVLYRAFNKEGKGQNLKAGNYYRDRWEVLKKFYSELLSDLYNRPRKLTISDFEQRYNYMPWARLPIDKFGISVDDWEF